MPRHYDHSIGHLRCPSGAIYSVVRNDLSCPAGEILPQQIRTAERHHGGTKPTSAYDLVRHDASVHNVNDIGFELGDSSGYSAPQAVVGEGAFLPAINKQHSNVE